MIISGVEIIDTAVKVGLGALITGLSSYWLTRANHKYGLEKERVQHRRKMFERISEQVEALDVSTADFISHPEIWCRVNANHSDTDPDPDALVADQKRVLANLTKQLEGGTQTAGLLLLLGERECYERLVTFIRLVEAQRKSAFGSGLELTAEDVAARSDEVIKARESFFEALSSAYSRT